MKSTRSAAVLTVVAALAGACGGETPGRGAAAGEPGFCQDVLTRVDSFTTRAAADRPVEEGGRYGGTVVVSGNGELQGMNAVTTNDYVTSQHQVFVNLMTLLRYDAELQPEPYLAESWEISPDTTAVTFHLRHDVFWHDGVKTTAEDVAFTYERMTDPASGFPNPAFWDYYVKGSEGVEVVDSFTVRVHMLRPHAEFLDPWRSAAIVPAHLLRDVPVAELAEHPYGTVCPVGNGPFVFVEHRPQESWTFRANPAFPRALGGRPFLDRYVYRVVGEPTTALADLLTERTDVYIAPPPSQADEILAAEDVELRSFPFRDYVFVAWNARRPELSDPRVRRALTLGTNRQEVVDALLGGYGQVAETGIPPSHWAYDPGLEGAMAYDPERARRLLEQAGWVDRDGDGVRENAAGESLSISIKYNEGSQTRQGIAEIMQAQLARIGVQARPEVVEYNTLLQQVTTPERDFDGVVMGFVAEFKLDERDQFHSARIDQPLAFSGTRNPELDRLLDTLQLVVDRDAARTLWSEYQRELVDEQPATYFYFGLRLAGVNRRLRGVEMDARGEWLNVGGWWIDPAERRTGSSGAP